VSALAVSLNRIDRRISDPAQDVHSTRHRVEMGRIHASRVSAEMIDMEPLRDRTLRHLEGEPVGVAIFNSPSKCAVSRIVSAHPCAGPYPTRRGYFNLLKKTLLGGGPRPLPDSPELRIVRAMTNLTPPTSRFVGQFLDVFRGQLMSPLAMGFGLVCHGSGAHGV
jgi:hypothetical protein